MTVTIPAALEERGSALLVALGAQGVWVEEAGEQVHLNVFFPESVSVADAEGLIQGAFVALLPEKLEIRSERLPEEEWQTAWQTHSIPIQQIGEKLVIVPPWEKNRLIASNRKVIVLSPGMAFGTGTHATTHNCLVMLEKAVLKVGEGRLLDVGTGSGILAIAAAKLGVRHITATEIDPVALAVAQENAKANRVVSKMIFRASIPAHSRYNCLLANLTSSVLLELSERLTQAVLPGGTLVLSGMLKGAHEAVLARFQTACTLIQLKEKDNWVSLFMQKK